MYVDVYSFYLLSVSVTVARCVPKAANRTACVSRPTCAAVTSATSATTAAPSVSAIAIATVAALMRPTNVCNVETTHRWVPGFFRLFYNFESAL